jgi:hypothetical protein
MKLKSANLIENLLIFTLIAGTIYLYFSPKRTDIIRQPDNAPMEVHEQKDSSTEAITATFFALSIIKEAAPQFPKYLAVFTIEEHFDRAATKRLKISNYQIEFNEVGNIERRETDYKETVYAKEFEQVKKFPFFKTQTAEKYRQISHTTGKASLDFFEDLMGGMVGRFMSEFSEKISMDSAHYFEQELNKQKWEQKPIKVSDAVGRGGSLVMESDNNSWCKAVETQGVSEKDMLNTFPITGQKELIIIERRGIPDRGILFSPNKKRRK